MQKQEMSPRLKQFYRELLEWVEEQEVESHFNPTVGICCNLSYWSKGLIERIDLGTELQHQFIVAGLDTEYPFNESFNHYRSESDSYGTYQNEKRLAWIKEHAK